MAFFIVTIIIVCMYIVAVLKGKDDPDPWPYIIGELANSIIFIGGNVLDKLVVAKNFITELKEK